MQSSPRDKDVPICITLKSIIALKQILKSPPSDLKELLLVQVKSWVAHSTTVELGELISRHRKTFFSRTTSSSASEFQLLILLQQQISLLMAIGLSTSVHVLHLPFKIIRSISGLVLVHAPYQQQQHASRLL